MPPGEQLSEIESKMLSIPLEKFEEYKAIKTNEDRKVSDETLAEMTTWGTTDDKRTERERIIIEEQDKTIQHLRSEVQRLTELLKGLRYDPNHDRQQYESYRKYHLSWLSNISYQLAEFEKSIKNGTYVPPPPFSPPQLSFIEDILSPVLDDIE